MRAAKFILDNGSGNTLLLTTGEVDAPGANYCVVAVGQVFHKLLALGSLRCRIQQHGSCKSKKLLLTLRYVKAVIAYEGNVAIHPYY